MPTLKVFISLTYIDLKDYRQKAIEIINRYKCVPLAMEFFMAQPEEPTRVYEKEIKECDILLGIYAHRYGFTPKGQEKSITQQEYELAKKLKKSCHCFIVDEDFQWKPKFCEFEKRPQLNVFLKTIRDENTTSFFTTTTDFESKLSSSLGKLLLEREQKAKGEKREAKSDKLIPHRSHAIHRTSLSPAAELYR